MATIDYTFAPNMMVYARFATGFKSGGFNGRANSVAERTQYEPETVNSYEIGLRSTIAQPAAAATSPPSATTIATSRRASPAPASTR